MSGRAILLVLAGLLASCSTSRARVHELHVDPDFTNEERAALFSAAAKWNAVATSQILLTDDPAAHGEIVRRAPAHMNAFATTERDHVEISPGLPPEIFAHVAMHELGHVLRLDYSINGVMRCDGSTYPVDLSGEDIEECRRVEACE